MKNNFMTAGYADPEVFSALLSRIKLLGQAEEDLEINKVKSRTEQVLGAEATVLDAKINAQSAQVEIAWRDPELTDLLKQCVQIPEDELSEISKRHLQEIVKHHSFLTSVPADISHTARIIENSGRGIHKQAQEANDWSIVRDHLLEVMENQRAMGKAIADSLNLDSPLDGMLAVWSPGFSSREIDDYFEALCPQIRELQQQRQLQQAPTKPLTGPFPVDEQERLALSIMEDIGLDFERGGLIVSGKASIEGGVRDYAVANIQRSKDDTQFFNYMKSFIHEGFHEIYIQGLPDQYRFMPLGHDMGGVVHESQALFEMVLGRSLPFCRYVANKAKEVLGWKIDPEQLYAIRNLPSFGEDRKKADELTYHLHVSARWKAYKELFEGKVDVDEFPERLAEIYKEVVGLVVKDPVNLALSDVHYFNGKGALYPSYTLGHGIACQLQFGIKQDMPDIDTQIEVGNFKNFTRWLKERIHSKGRLFSIPDLIEQASGRAFDLAKYQIEHLTHRFNPDLMANKPQSGLTGPTGMA